MELTDLLIPEHLHEIWPEYVAMRKMIKHPMTPYAQTLALRKLRGFSRNPEIQVKIVEQSIEHSWTGLFQLREDQAQSVGNELRMVM